MSSSWAEPAASVVSDAVRGAGRPFSKMLESAVRRRRSSSSSAPSAGSSPAKHWAAPSLDTVLAWSASKAVYEEGPIEYCEVQTQVFADFDMHLLPTADHTSVLSTLPNAFCLWKLSPTGVGHLAQWSVSFIADTIFVTFRGTINAMDLVIDLSVVPAPLVGSGGSTDIMVPSGMLASVVWEEPYIIAAINELMESRLRAATAAATTTTNAAAGTRQSGHGFSKIVFAGHSLGGGLATVCALRFVDLHRFPELRRIVRTFGSPQVDFESTRGPFGIPGADGEMRIDPDRQARSAATWDALDVHNFVLFGDVVPRLMQLRGPELQELVRRTVLEYAPVGGSFFASKALAVARKVGVGAADWLRNGFVPKGVYTILLSRHCQLSLEAESLPSDLTKALVDGEELRPDDVPSHASLRTLPNGSMATAFKDHRVKTYHKHLLRFMEWKHKPGVATADLPYRVLSQVGYLYVNKSGWLHGSTVPEKQTSFQDFHHDGRLYICVVDGPWAGYYLAASRGQGVGCYRFRGDASHWEWDKKRSTLQCTNGSCKGRFLALKASAAGSTPLSQSGSRSKKEHYFYCEHPGSKRFGLALVRKQLIRPSSSSGASQAGPGPPPASSDQLSGDNPPDADALLSELAASKGSSSSASGVSPTTIESLAELALERVGTSVEPQSSQTVSPTSVAASAARGRSNSASLRRSAPPILRRALSLPLEALQGSATHALQQQRFESIDSDHREAGRAFGSGKKRALSLSLRVTGERRASASAAAAGRSLPRRHSLSVLRDSGRVSPLSAESKAILSPRATAAASASRSRTKSFRRDDFLL